MASFNAPQLPNHIADDIPAIRTLLGSLAKLTPDSGNTDYPVGTKRLAESASGYEFQQWNGSGWVTLEKWNIDVQKVDGYSAATGTTAGTIPVRDANGRIPGDITGTAEKAKEAEGLSKTLGIGKGGTGGTTAEQARLNLGVAPTSHASSSADYGIGTENQYGHTKPHDEPDASLTAAGGHAFSPAGAAAMQDALEGQIDSLAGVVSGNASSQAAKDAEQDAAITETGKQVAAVDEDLRALIAEEVAKALDAANDAQDAADVANAGLIGVVRSVNGVDADATGKVSLDEYGSDYVRFSSGLQICWTTVTTGSNASSVIWSFPNGFVSAPRCSVTYLSVGSGVAVATGLINNSTSSITVRFATNNCSGHAIAVGRWK